MTCLKAKKVSLLKQREDSLIKIGYKFFKFMLAGLPGFFAAILLNAFLVEYVKLSIPITYFFVLVIQTVINFLFCGKFAFNQKSKDFIRFGVFFKFSSSVIIFRLLNWFAYYVMVHFLFVYYLLAQFINVIFFSILKYLVLKKVFTLKNYLEDPMSDVLQKKHYAE
ncbi:MAG: hypothetical protein PVG30_07290 [Gammaproteobacteria bacterium]|jgi:putative flippase GtrA